MKTMAATKSGRPPALVRIRFEEKILPEPMSGCWLWDGAVNKAGYGRFTIKSGETVYAHRFSYEIYVAKITYGLVIDHTCNNQSCVNPGHLEEVSRKENNYRSYVRDGRGPPIPKGSKLVLKTHCKRGHLMDEENTLLTKGVRRCRICKRATNLRWYLKNDYVDKRRKVS